MKSTRSRLVPPIPRGRGHDVRVHTKRRPEAPRARDEARICDEARALTKSALLTKHALLTKQARTARVHGGAVLVQKAPYELAGREKR
eukprot:6186770-Pleurochrysis_carterae.AAC.2